MHIVRILREYMGLTQAELAEKAGISCADANEIEQGWDYGTIDKYCKLAAFLQVPVHAIVMNDIFSIPESFFENMPPAAYLSSANSKNSQVGREGEDTVFAMEQERLRSVHPVLARLVIPWYKLRYLGGYDILSFRENGTPLYIEVKTSEKESAGIIQLTKHEYDTAKKLTDKGYEYWIYYFTNWNSEKQSLEKIPFGKLDVEDRISPARYLCDIRPRRETENGIRHFRRQMQVTQNEASRLLDIPPSCLCKYETGENQCPVTAYQKMVKLYRVTVDELLKEYPVKQKGDPIHL